MSPVECPTCHREVPTGGRFTDGAVQLRLHYDNGTYCPQMHTPVGGPVRVGDVLPGVLADLAKRAAS